MRSSCSGTVRAGPLPRQTALGEASLAPDNSHASERVPEGVTTDGIP